MIRRPPRSTLDRSSAASDVYKRQEEETAKKELLENTLKENLLTKARKELPEGFIIYDDAVILDKQSPEMLSLIHISEPTRPY